MVVVTAGPGASHKVLLIAGKRTGSSEATQPGFRRPPVGFSRPLSAVLPPSASSSPASSDSDSPSVGGGGPPMRKRQRLTHLSPEEKALRRKLKNRVAAQTARDRKKAKMGELEQQVLELELENHKLHIENGLLREKSSGLVTENEELRQRLGLNALETKESVSIQDGTLLNQIRSTQAMCASAAGAGPVPSKPEDFPMVPDGPDASDNESDLLLGILDILDPELFLKSCEQECAEPQVLLVGRGHPLPAAPPAALGAAPVKLEALNELIHFDHIYTKPVDVEECDGQHSGHTESDTEVKIEAPVYRASSYEDDAATDADDEVELETETVYVKDEPQEEAIPRGRPTDDFLSAAALGGLDKEAYLADAYSDSGYERSPSPISDMSSSPLCSESSWEDVFANELFPQLFSV
ncbi:X-box-binding protein 1 [Gadus chalcogrammus]|uniref:X-box-binding protein 1 n=1 Tax=Gadus chalcogrammus TaxID=1042646 RepID=UPI0024C2CE74|nr:X-box-binding protein 1 [Gadus chalcogrammus]